MLVLLVIIICGILMYQMWKYKELIKLSWQMPNVSVWLIIRHYYSLKKGLSENGIVYPVQYFALNVFKGCYTWWFGSTLYVVIKDPEEFKTVFNSPDCLNRGTICEFFKCIIKNGIAYNMPEAQKSRKMLQPALSFKSIESFIPIFDEKTRIFISLIEKLCNKNDPTDILDYTNPLTMDTILLTTTGIKENAQENDESVVFKHVINVIGMVGKRFSNPLLHWHPIYRMTSNYKEESKSCDYLLGRFNELFDEKVLEWKTEQQNTQKINETDLDKPKMVLDQLLHAHINEQALNKEALLGDCKLILTAGYHTTAVVSAFSILMLAMHPKFQDKLYDEISSIDMNDNVCKYDFHKCDFLDRFIKETLRLFPPIPAFSRTVTQHIKLGNYTIPPETNIIGSIFTLHRDKDFWGPTADEFDPDRFLPEVFDKIHPYAYLPFGGGPRSCLGIKYAQVFLKIILIHTVRNFKFRTDLKFADLQCKIDLTITLNNKHMVFVEKRHT